MRKTLLMVAMPGSIHVVRWINQLVDQDLDIHIFPSTGGVIIHPEMEGVTFHSPIFPWAKKIGKHKRGNSSRLSLTAADFLRSYLKKSGSTSQCAECDGQNIGSSQPQAASLSTEIPDPTFAQQIRQFLRQQVLERFMPGFRGKRLLKVIRSVRPDLVHSLEIQAAGRLTLEAKQKFAGSFPSWLVTNWGSDIFLFGKLQRHQAKIREVLANCDFYSCECERDVRLARQFGFSGLTMPVFPNTGGFDLAELKEVRERIQVSDRKVILLKGYQNWAGRSLVGLRALSRCKDVLAGYSVVIYLASPDVDIAAELFADETGIPVRIIPNNTPHQEILSLHAKARISIGLSISDAISTSFLEAMVMGSFPIQSCTACVDEWIEHGVSGMIVPPEDPDIIEMAIRSALSDDVLVNEAAAINWRIAQERLDSLLIKKKVIDMYSSLWQER